MLTLPVHSSRLRCSISEATKRKRLPLRAGVGRWEQAGLAGVWLFLFFLFGFGGFAGRSSGGFGFSRVLGLEQRGGLLGGAPGGFRRLLGRPLGLGDQG